MRLYSTAPFAPVAVAVSVVVPPLQEIDPALAETAIEHAGAGITSTVEEEELSAVTSPGVAGPEADPGATPLENKRLPDTVNGPPSVSPLTAIRMVRAVFGGIWSVPLDTRITPEAFEMIDQPEGNK